MGNIQHIGALSPEEKRALLTQLLRQNARQPKPYPLSFGQQRLWFLNQLMPDSPVHNIPFAIRIVGAVNIPALKRSLDEVVRRHEVLRTTFATENGLPIQVVTPTLTVPLTVLDLTELPEEKRDAEAWRRIVKEVQHSFDLTKGPLGRIHLLQLGPEEYIMLLVLHHIISDGWSMVVFMREVVTLYQAFSTGQPSPLPELPVQYADFAVWQQQWLQGEGLHEQLAYWKEQLSGQLPVLELPTDHRRPPALTFQGATQRFQLPDPLYESLKELCRQEGTTLFMTLLAVFKTLLYRYTGQIDIIVGSPIAGRNRPELESLIGFFVNTLILRTDLSGNPGFRRLLNRVRDVCLETYNHQDIPFERLVEEVQPDRTLNRAPLAQVGFAFEMDPRQAVEIPGGMRVEPLEVDNGAAQLDLTLFMWEGIDGLTGAVQYSTELFQADTIRRIVEHFQTVLEAIVANPDQRIGELQLLTAEERRQLLVEWNETRVNLPENACLQELLEVQVEQTPDASAVVFLSTSSGDRSSRSEDEHLTYRELNQRANQLAHYLRSIGVGSENLVGICTERSVEMIVGVLGTLKAGGAYLPLDPAYPRERLGFMLEDAQVPVLLSQEHLMDKLPEHTAEVIYLDSDWAIIAQESEENPVNETLPNNLAYAIYTSGSTGTPKGVLVEHRGVCNLAKAQIRAFGVRPGSRILQFASLSFDASVSEIFMALLSGATLYLATEQDSPWLGSPFVQLLRNHQITTVTLPPSVLAALPAEDLPSLQTIISAGEDCSADLVAQWAPGRRFFNAYGPTEATVCATITECTTSDKKPPIGYPIDNVQVYLLDDHLQPVPVGVPGELHIGGVGVARGYLNRPDLTADKFVPNPFVSDEPGTRLYKTGDLARYLPDGNIEFLGRIDHQIKIRGYRIELEEIEAVLRQHRTVQEALVLASENDASRRHLTAYVVLQTGETATVSELRDYLRAKLPAYMVPAAFTVLDTLPLTSNGKVDRRALPVPDRTRPELAVAFVSPRTSVEEKLAEIWAKMLNIERVGIHDDFFELGGHSLLALQLITQVQEAFQVELPLLRFFELPTVAGLAQTIDSVRQAGSSAVSTSEPILDLSAEAVLDPTVNLDGKPVNCTATDPACIFLTGATGFLGATLLQELLQQTQADIFCLVRASNINEGEKRLQRALESYSLWDQRLKSRIVPLPGDLAQPLLGLSAEEFRLMANRVDVIYHAGAWVNYIYPYSTLKTTNVLGTQEVLRLATQEKAKPVHFVSTLSVFSPVRYGGEVVHEQVDLDYSEGLNSGYAQSKWVAEKLIRIARSRGLPVCIYRPARITGHSQTGICSTSDFLWQLIKACIRIGRAPDLDVMVDMTPVDYVSRAIVQLSQQEESLGKAFHLNNPHPIHLSHLVELIRSLGYPLQQTSFGKWQTELTNFSEHFQGGDEHPYLHILFGMSQVRIPSSNGPSPLSMPRFDSRNTRRALAGTSIVCPPVNAELISTYFSYLTSSGFLMAPNLV